MPTRSRSAVNGRRGGTDNPADNQQSGIHVGQRDLGATGGLPWAASANVLMTDCRVEMGK